MKANTLKGSLLNDLHLAACLRQAKETKWVVRTNPYEGGSDHTVFAEAGVPSLLNWHFTDRFYHTNLDRPTRLGLPRFTTSAWPSRRACGSSLRRRPRRHGRCRSPVGFSRRAAGARAEAGNGTRRCCRRPGEGRGTEAAVAAAWRTYIEALESVLATAGQGLHSHVDAKIAQAQQRLKFE